jgi:hypothetical protein
MRRGWLVLVVALAGWEPFRTPHPAVERGNRAYHEQRWDDAVAAYEAARGDEATTPTIDYDVGTALLRKAEAMPAGPARTAVEDRALAALARAGQAPDPALRSRAHYNRGNALLARDKLDDAIAAYKDALRADRGFEDARLNLEQALRRRPTSSPPPGKGGQGRGGQRAPGDQRGQPGQEQQPDPHGQLPPAPGQGGQEGTPGGPPAGAPNDTPDDTPDDAPDAPPGGSGELPPDATGGADPRAGQGNTSPDTPAQPPGDRQPGAQRGPRPTPRSPSSPADRKLDDLERSSRDLRREQIRRRAQDSYRPPTGPDW